MRGHLISIGHVLLALAPIALLTLAACERTTDTVAIDLRPLAASSPPATSAEARAARLVACNAFRPIDWSSRDTDETILAAKEHNAAYAEICEAK